MDETTVVETPAETTVTETPAVTEPAPVATENTPAPAAVSDDEAMWGDLKEDPAPTPETPALPEEYAKVLSISEYVKEPAHLEFAVKAAQEMWDVQTGKVPATALLEGLRSNNPQMYEKVILEQIVPYIEQVTGKKLGDAPAEDRPMTVQEYEQRRQQDAQRAEQERQQAEQERQQQAFQSSAEQAGSKKLTEYIQAGNGIFEGDSVEDVSHLVGKQFAKMGVKPQDAMKKVMEGDFSQLEKAYKAAENAETLRVKTYTDRIRAKYNKLRNTVPKAGGGTQAEAGGSGEHDLTTASGRARAMAKAFAEGRDTI